MVFFEWDDDYLIGIESLDYEHRELFDYFNELHEELARHQDKAAIENCLGEIHARVAVHFALEETGEAITMGDYLCRLVLAWGRVDDLYMAVDLGGL